MAYSAWTMWLPLRNVKLVINFVNNWSDYGGMAAYATAFGGSQTTWYTNTAAQTANHAYIKAIVSRYINSPAVFAWELANEPHCNGCDTSVLYNWFQSTSAYIKSRLKAYGCHWRWYLDP